MLMVFLIMTIRAHTVLFENILSLFLLVLVISSGYSRGGLTFVLNVDVEDL